MDKLYLKVLPDGRPVAVVGNPNCPTYVFEPAAEAPYTETSPQFDSYVENGVKSAPVAVYVRQTDEQVKRDEIEQLALEYGLAALERAKLSLEYDTVTAKVVGIDKKMYEFVQKMKDLAGIKDV